MHIHARTRKHTRTHTQARTYTHEPTYLAPWFATAKKGKRYYLLYEAEFYELGVNGSEVISWHLGVKLQSFLINI